MCLFNSIGDFKHVVVSELCPGTRFRSVERQVTMIRTFSVMPQQGAVCQSGARVFLPAYRATESHENHELEGAGSRWTMLSQALTRHKLHRSQQAGGQQG